MKFKTLYKKIINSSSDTIDFDLKPYENFLNGITSFEKYLEKFSEQELKNIANEFLTKFNNTHISNQQMIECYGLVKEVIKRQLKLVPFDVQIIAAIALHQQKIIEMQTGEGKTLTAVFPAYLNALSKKGVHVLTFNDYLAKRDANWMRPVYEFLGLSVDFIKEGMNRKQKRNAYNSDITYATAKEVGFDYLRSFIAYEPMDIFQRPFHYAIIDEADALMVDEARNPLVLAGDIIKSGIDFVKIAELTADLKSKADYGIDEYSRNIYLTEKGVDKIEKQLSIDNLHSEEHFELHSAINLSIHARMLLKKDIDYVVKSGEIKLVDEFTGRIVEDRKWRNGLQTAVEAKEGLKIQSEGNILNSISLQHFINQYPKKTGMSGTAKESAEEFRNFYGLDVLIIPPNKKCQRIDYPDEIFTSKLSKNLAILEEVKKVNKLGQPVLIGTLTVKESEELSVYFNNNNIKCQVLNARNDELEAEIIADAGKFGAVTISTNMAGRGTDILLGGRDGMDKAKVIEAGGLYVIGTNRHESIRIDRQLRGRAGRQGDKGISRFFISLEDDLMIKYRLKFALPKKYRNLNSYEALKNEYIKKYISHIQRVMEGQSYDMRRTLFDYSDFVEKQRRIIQDERQKLLFNDDLLLARVELDQIEKTKILKIHDLLMKIRELSLFQYDKFWALHLDFLQQIRESIHLVRIGGQNPIREFQKKADQSFKELCENIDVEIRDNILEMLKNQNISLADLGIKKPSSTWTYVINDNPFGKQLAIMLLNNANIGMQADPLSGIILGFYGIFERLKSRKTSKEIE